MASRISNLNHDPLTQMTATAYSRQVSWLCASLFPIHIHSAWSAGFMESQEHPEKVSVKSYKGSHLFISGPSTELFPPFGMLLFPTFCLHLVSLFKHHFLHLPSRDLTPPLAPMTPLLLSHGTVSSTAFSRQLFVSALFCLSRWTDTISEGKNRGCLISCSIPSS